MRCGRVRLGAGHRHITSTPVPGPVLGLAQTEHQTLWTRPVCYPQSPPSSPTRRPVMHPGSAAEETGAQGQYLGHRRRRTGSP